VISLFTRFPLLAPHPAFILYTILESRTGWMWKLRTVFSAQQQQQLTRETRNGPIVSLRGTAGMHKTSRSTPPVSVVVVDDSSRSRSPATSECCEAGSSGTACKAQAVLRIPSTLSLDGFRV